jgi:hypothetical protein
MKFTEPELSYVRRFCWELYYLKYGDRPTENQCPGHYNGLSDLAHASGVAPQVLTRPRLRPTSSKENGSGRA